MYIHDIKTKKCDPRDLAGDLGLKVDDPRLIGVDTENKELIFSDGENVLIRNKWLVGEQDDDVVAIYDGEPDDVLFKLASWYIYNQEIDLPAIVYMGMPKSMVISKLTFAAGIHNAV